MLVLDVDRFVVVLRVDDDWKVKLLRIRPGKAGVAIGAPLHRRAATVPVAQINVVAHSDFVAIVNDWRARHGEEHGVKQLHFAPAVGEQRREPAANTEIDSRMRVVRVNAPHVIALLIGHHFEGKLVMIAQKHGPLAVLGNGRRLIENVDDRKPILHLQRHEHPRHEREMETHVRFVAFAEISDRVFRPLVCFGQKHSALKFCIEMRTQVPQEIVSLGQVFADRALALIEVRDRVEAKSINSQVKPEIADLLDGFVHGRVLEIQVRLMGIEAMPVICFRDRIPGPVRCFEIFKNNSRVFVFFRCVTPNVKFVFR